MNKKILIPLATFALCLFNASAYAAHSAYSPMSPRQIAKVETKKDYSYGLTVLPGRSIDGIEVLNRQVGWNLNYCVLDRYFLRPIAHGYDMLPEFTKAGVHNFFSNIKDANSTLQNALVGRGSDSLSSLGRFGINSTVGLLGLIDVATPLGIEKKEMNFNTVLGIAGADQGEYIMVPGMGPQTQRSLSASVVDGWPYYFLTPWGAVAVLAVDLVDTRAGLIPQEQLIDDAVDPYAQTRHIYLMYQEGKVNPESSMEVKADENVEEFLDEIDSL